MKKVSSVWSALIILIVSISVIIWLVTALTNNDLLWFWRVFPHQADWLIIYWDGAEYMLFPGDEGYAAIMPTFATGVAKWKGYESSVGMSEANLTLIREGGQMLEVHFNEPTQVHTSHLYPAAHVYFIPLDGTHATYRRVFGALREIPRPGVLNLSEEYFDALRTAVEAAVNQRR